MNYIVDDIGLVVDAVREAWITSDATQILIDNGIITVDGGMSPPYYMYGHRLEIANRLTKKDSDKVEKKRKYPMIALRLDTSEAIEGQVANYTLNLAIIHQTKQTYNAEERYENVFKPILYPLYELFFEKLREAGLFWWDGPLEKPVHTKIDRPFFGTTGDEKNQKHLFKDPLDAIEIVDLRISKRLRTC